VTTQIGVQTNFPRAWPMGSAFTFRILMTNDGLSTGTATTLTGRAYKFTLKKYLADGKTVDNTSAAIVSKTSGASEITFSNVAGTADAADVAILSTDAPVASVAPGRYAWSLARTDDPNDRYEAYGWVELFRVAEQ